MKDLLIGIFLCLLGAGIIWYLEKKNRSVATYQDKTTIRLWITGIALLVAGIYFIAIFFGVDFSV